MSTRTLNSTSPTTDSGEIQASATYVMTGLAPGNTSFQTFYRVGGLTNPGQSVTFANRSLIVIPLP
jgi:hypothetical protein